MTLVGVEPDVAVFSGLLPADATSAPVVAVVKNTPVGPDSVMLAAGLEVTVTSNEFCVPEALTSADATEDAATLLDVLVVRFATPFAGTDTTGTKADVRDGDVTDMVRALSPPEAV